MKTKEFLNILENNFDKELLFEYASNKLVGANYHLTEVKNVFFDTVDCGGKTNSWSEIHVQLWESPKEIGKKNYLTVDKALSILNRVDRVRPLLQEAEIKIEYGNASFSTSVMQIEKIQTSKNYLKVSLFVEATKCKANDICGIPEIKEEKNACCTTTGCC